MGVASGRLFPAYSRLRPCRRHRGLVGKRGFTDAALATVGTIKEGILLDVYRPFPCSFFLSFFPVLCIGTVIGCWLGLSQVSDLDDAR